MKTIINVFSIVTHALEANTAMMIRMDVFALQDNICKVKIVIVMQIIFGMKTIQIAFSIVNHAQEVNSAMRIIMDVCALKTNTGITQNV